MTFQRRTIMTMKHSQTMTKTSMERSNEFESRRMVGIIMDDSSTFIFIMFPSSFVSELRTHQHSLTTPYSFFKGTCVQSSSIHHHTPSIHHSLSCFSFIH